MNGQEILEAAAIKIAEAQRQRDKARRELSRAKHIIRELLIAFTADAEAEEDEHSEKLRVVAKAERFAGSPDYRGRRA